MIPRLVLSDKKGNIFVHPTLKMMGKDLRGYVALAPQEVIALPRDSAIFYMPGRVAVGWDEGRKMPVPVSRWLDREVFPAGALMIPGFTRLYLPAAEKLMGAPVLPLWPYTAVGWQKGAFRVAAFQVDQRRHQRPCYYRDRALIKKNAADVLRRFPLNRLFKHLAFCALTYNCRNAQNLFLRRWEAPLPVSPSCNARCLGCLSQQESDCALASHQRISFVPTAHEVSEVGLYHLLSARRAMVSFGQGCEGEPLLQFALLAESIHRMRRATKRGMIHLNTNGFHPEYIKELAASGLGSVRFSLNSLSPDTYCAYYRPAGYDLFDVLSSVKEAARCGLTVSLNFLVMPGYSDSAEEVGRLLKFLKKGYVHMLQLRNLSIDADFFSERMPVPESRPLGVLEMVRRIKKEVPRLCLGYFNPGRV